MTTKQTPQRSRPEWMEAWLDYPHGYLEEKRAREIVWYANALEARHARIVEALKAAREPQAKLLNPAARGYVNGIDLALKLMEEG